MEAAPMLELMPISLAAANGFVAEHHRHHKPVRGHKFSLGCMADGQLVGVAIVGRPVSRFLSLAKMVHIFAFKEAFLACS